MQREEILKEGKKMQVSCKKVQVKVNEMRPKVIKDKTSQMGKSEYPQDKPYLPKELRDGCFTSMKLEAATWRWEMN